MINTALKMWCRSQVRHHRRGTLKESRMKRLVEAGFDFTIGEEQMHQKAKLEKWERMFGMLVRFYAGKAMRSFLHFSFQFYVPDCAILKRTQSERALRHRGRKSEFGGMVS